MRTDFHGGMQLAGKILVQLGIWFLLVLLIGKRSGIF
jgi:hypothetical protein